jgi:hypothetical protein
MLAASLCMTSSHLFHGLPTGLPPPKLLLSTFFGIQCCSILTTCPAHINHNIYLPPAVRISPAELTNIISQLPPLLILLGDFNAKNILWGAVLTDISVHCPMYVVGAGIDLIILNTGAHTHLCIVSGTLSALDLVCCSPRLAAHPE